MSQCENPKNQSSLGFQTPVHKFLLRKRYCTLSHHSRIFIITELVYQYGSHRKSCHYRSIAMTDIERLRYFDERYVISAKYYVGKLKKKTVVPSTTASPKTCRFCGKSSPDTTFRKGIIYKSDKKKRLVFT